MRKGGCRGSSRGAGGRRRPLPAWFRAKIFDPYKIGGEFKTAEDTINWCRRRGVNVNNVAIVDIDPENYDGYIGCRVALERFVEVMKLCSSGDYNEKWCQTLLEIRREITAKRCGLHID